MIQRNGKIFHAIELEGVISLKWTYYPKQSTDLIQSIKIPMTFFHRTRTNIPKIYMEPQKTQNCQSNPEEKELSWRHNPFTLNSTKLQSETVW